MRQQFTTVGNLADHFGVPPKLLSSLFWQRVLDAEKCPVVSGRRLIPTDYVETIGEVLRERGYLAGAAAAR